MCHWRNTARAALVTIQDSPIKAAVTSGLGSTTAAIVYAQCSPPTLLGLSFLTGAKYKTCPQQQSQHGAPRIASASCLGDKQARLHHKVQQHRPRTEHAATCHEQQMHHEHPPDTARSPLPVIVTREEESVLPRGGGTCNNVRIHMHHAADHKCPKHSHQL